MTERTQRERGQGEGEKEGKQSGGVHAELSPLPDRGFSSTLADQR